MARWYIIHAYSGFENKVRDSVLAEAERIHAALARGDELQQLQAPRQRGIEREGSGPAYALFG